MEIIQARLHLLTLPVEKERDPFRIRKATTLIAGRSRLESAAISRVSDLLYELAAGLLRRQIRGRMRFFLSRSLQGQTGFEMICEAGSGRGAPVLPIASPAQIRLLEEVMDEVEVKRGGGVEIRAVKWGPPDAVSDLQGHDNEFPAGVIEDDAPACMENLREKHEELLRKLEESARQNEELNRLNVELYHLNRDMETAAAERAISEMALRVAHEIRNPATVLSGLVKKLLREGAISEGSRPKVETILEKTRQLEEIVSRFEKLASRRAYFKRNEDLVEIMQESADILRNEFHQKQVDLRLEHEQGEFSLKANVGMLKIALTHLLRNALEACQPGGMVLFSLSRAPGRYLIRVEDNGTGIEPHKLERILEPFVTTKPARIGLGLSIVKQIVEEHRGRLALQSELGKGTTVTIEFPVIYLPS